MEQLKIVTGAMEYVPQIAVVHDAYLSVEGGVSGSDGEILIIGDRRAAESSQSTEANFSIFVSPDELLSANSLDSDKLIYDDNSVISLYCGENVAEDTDIDSSYRLSDFNQAEHYCFTTIENDISADNGDIIYFAAEQPAPKSYVYTVKANVSADHKFNISPTHTDAYSFTITASDGSLLTSGSAKGDYTLNDFFYRGEYTVTIEPSRTNSTSFAVSLTPEKDVEKSLGVIL